MSTNLYIRHAIGSMLLLDCHKQQSPFNITEKDHRWLIQIENVEKESYDRLVSHKNELNIFFQEIDGKKHWYYASDSPEITYHSDRKTLTIVVDSKMSYAT